MSKKKKGKEKELVIPSTIEYLSDSSQYNLANMICTLTLLGSEFTEIEEEIYLCCIIPMLAHLDESYYTN